MPLRLTFFGHSMVRIDLAGTMLLTDPILRPRVTFLTWRAPTPEPRTWEAVDAVLISHLHHDHCDLTSLARLGRDRRLVVPHGSEALFRSRGFTRVVGMLPGQSRPIGNLTVTATAAEHDGRRYRVGAGIPALGYVVAGEGIGVYFAGDTDLFPGMHEIGEVTDVALLPVWGWGSSLGEGHLDPIRAAEAVARIQPEVAIPIHWGGLTTAWHRDPPRADPAASFVEQVRTGGGPTEAVVLMPGGAAAAVAI
jgi:L-ascorbate metabolism protein UlaG (beta-lactamase superfamily)